MISPSEYDRLCDQLITLYSDLENSIISDITRRILKTGRITESAEWQIKQLQESGMLYDDILAEIAKRTDATENHVRALFEDAGVQSIRNDNRFYRAAGLAGIVKMSDAALQTLNAGYMKCGGDLKNLTMTTAFTSQQAYITACNNAYMQVTSGAFDYNTAIRNAIKSAAVEGTHVLYPSGHKDRIDVAVRRAVLTGVGQTVRQLSMINAEDMGCDIMEITAHSGARPSHAAWQGKLVSLSGKNAGKIIEGCCVLSLSEIGYGSGDGFGGWNCRHDWYPFFEGISKRAYSDERLKELDAKNIEYNGKKYSEYEISQIQRRYEREIRAAKREQVAFKTAVEEAENPELRQVMQDSLNYANSVVKDKQAKMRDFINQTGQFRDYSREQNYGRVNYPKNSGKALTSPANSGKMESVKKSSSFRIPITNKTIENIPLIQPEGFSAEDAVALQNAHKALLKEARKHPLGTECAMLLDLDMEQIGDIIVGNIDNAKIPHCSDYHIAIHNHSSGLTFSVTDIKAFSQNDNMQMLIAIGNNGKIYTLSRTVSFDSEKFMNYFNEMLNKPIFREKAFNQLDEGYIKTLTSIEKQKLKKVLTDFSEYLIKGAVSHGAVYAT